MKCSFESLFHRALKEWPETLDIAELQYQDDSRYSVLGLGKRLEQIEHGYIGGKDEIIWRELHWAIYTVIHSVAKNLLEIQLSSIRVEAVRHLFEQRLQSAIAAKDPAWDTEDFDLAQAYLRP